MLEFLEALQKGTSQGVRKGGRIGLTMSQKEHGDKGFEEEGLELRGAPKVV